MYSFSDICLDRISILSFWVKAMDIPSIRKQTFMWVGRIHDNVTVLEVYHENGITRAHYQTALYESILDFEIMPGLWTWLVVEIKLPKVESSHEIKMVIYINANKVAAVIQQVNHTEEPPIKNTGSIVAGAAGILLDGDVTSYINYGHVGIDDIIYKETYYSYRNWKKCNWFGREFEAIHPYIIYGKITIY